MSKSNYIGGGGKNSRSSRDFYPTDPRAVYPLLAREEFPGIIWEPACGDGAIVEAIYRYEGRKGYLLKGVYCSDIYDYGIGCVISDFFEYTVSDLKGLNRINYKMYGEKIECIITNPPYLIKHSKLGRVAVEQWVQHAHNLGIKKHAWLLKTTALAGKKRSVIFQECGLKTVYQFRERLDMMDGKKKTQKSMIDFAWFVFENGYVGDPVVKWITQETLDD